MDDDVGKKDRDSHGDKNSDSDRNTGDDSNRDRDRNRNSDCDDDGDSGTNRNSNGRNSYVAGDRPEDSGIDDDMDGDSNMERTATGTHGQAVARHGIWQARNPGTNDIQERRVGFRRVRRVRHGFLMLDSVIRNIDRSISHSVMRRSRIDDGGGVVCAGAE